MRTRVRAGCTDRMKLHSSPETASGSSSPAQYHRGVGGSSTTSPCPPHRYFLSTEDNPKRRHLYSAYTTGSFNRRCLSCEFSCGFVSGSFSPDTNYFLLNCKGPTVPYTAVYSTRDRLYQKLLDVETNNVLNSTLNSMQMPQVEYQEITIDDYNTRRADKPQCEPERKCSDLRRSDTQISDTQTSDFRCSDAQTLRPQTLDAQTSDAETLRSQTLRPQTLDAQTLRHSDLRL
ncbi:hypothetical protein QTP86_008718 [Hemibagrus guttatus]|nr:hypothetical protein QTP86_008718 [Hemibagrus guttatus]